MTKEQLISIATLFGAIENIMLSFTGANVPEWCANFADPGNWDWYYRIIFSLCDPERKIKAFFDALFSSPHEGSYLVIANHWTEGITFFLNEIMQLMKTIPDGLSAFTIFYKLYYYDAQGRDFYYPIEHQSNSDFGKTFQKILKGITKFILFSSFDNDADTSEDNSNADDTVSTQALVALIKRWFADVSKTAATLHEVTALFPAQLNRPEELQIARSTEALLLLHVLKVVYHVTGDQNFQDHYQRVKAQMLEAAKKWGVVKEDVLTRLFGSEVADAEGMRGTHQLVWIALYDLLMLEDDPETRDHLQTIMRDVLFYLGDNTNSLAHFIYSIYSNDPQHSISQGIESLLLFPSYNTPYIHYTTNKKGTYTEACSDNRLLEFGGCNIFSKLLGQEWGTVYAIPMDKRPRDASIWQKTPRWLTNGEPPKKFPGVDYLLAYWMGKAHGLLPPELPKPLPTVLPALLLLMLD